MQIRSLLLLLPALTSVKGTLNQPCIGTGGSTGVCISAISCSSAGGITINGACPADPANIKCCTKPRCGSGGRGNCRWLSDCADGSVTNQCPGPSGFRCCLSSMRGFGGYSPPRIPPVGACKRVAVNGARMIVSAFPGRVREVGCIRACSCALPSQNRDDHCCGMATDLMCSDAGGVATMSGREIAEWIMNHRTQLNLKYVIWGQRIWNPLRDPVRPWSSWRVMENRYSITENHWDHVHVSYN